MYSKIQSSIDIFVFRYRQSNVQRLLPASDCCRTLICAQRFHYRAIGSSRRLGGASEHLIDGSEKRICRLSFEFSSLHVIERHSNRALNNPAQIVTIRATFGKQHRSVSSQNCLYLTKILSSDTIIQPTIAVER